MRGPLCSVALVLALPLVTGQLGGSKLLDQLNSRTANVQPPLASNPVSRPSSAQKTLVNQSFQSGAVNVYRITPERRALLNTIRYAEGTWREGREEGYRLLYGGGTFHSLARHPEITVQRRYRSAAAGAYQFLPATWRAAAQQLNLPDFGPASQDQAALHLVERRGALSRFDREGLSADVLSQLAPEWASLPTINGNSAYGQPVRSVGELQAFYARELVRQGGVAVSERLGRA